MTHEHRIVLLGVLRAFKRRSCGQKLTDFGVFGLWGCAHLQATSDPIEDVPGPGGAQDLLHSRSCLLFLRAGGDGNDGRGVRKDLRAFVLKL